MIESQVAILAAMGYWELLIFILKKKTQTKNTVNERKNILIFFYYLYVKEKKFF